MNRIPYILLFLAAIFCMFMGLFVLIDPERVGNILAYEFSNFGGKSEFLTFYGGFYIGIGAFLFYASLIKKYTEAGLLFLCFSSLGALIVRSITLFQSEVETVFYQLLAGEITLFMGGLVGFLMIRKPSE